MSLHTIGSAPGPVLEVLEHGATMHRLHVTGGDGVRRNVLLGHPTIEDRLAGTHYLGGTIGRYANRIAHGECEVDGRPVELATNDRGNHLHGGPDGLDRREWTVESVSDDAITLSVVSPAGDQGYPGELTARATYAVSGSTLTLSLTATTDAPTLANLTSHAYLNLEGHDSGPLDEHVLTVPASQWVPIDATGLPHSGAAPVDGTPFDLRVGVRVGDLVRADHPEVEREGGLDHFLVVDGPGVRTHVVLDAPRNGTRVEIRSDQPGVQVYTGNAFGSEGREAPATDGGSYGRWAGVALEPCLAPDTPHHPEWGSALLRPGEEYRSTIEWVFGTL